MQLKPADARSLRTENGIARARKIILDACGEKYYIIQSNFLLFTGNDRIRADFKLRWHLL